jgi:hypothetical protein
MHFGAFVQTSIPIRGSLGEPYEAWRRSGIWTSNTIERRCGRAHGK